MCDIAASSLCLTCLQINCWCTAWWGGAGRPRCSWRTSWSARTWRWWTPWSTWRNAGASSPTGASWNSWESSTCSSWRKETRVSRADFKTPGARGASGEASSQKEGVGSGDPRRVRSGLKEVLVEWQITGEKFKLNQITSRQDLVKPRLNHHKSS